MLTVLSIAAISGALVFPLYFALRKDTYSPSVPLSVAVLSAAALELFDLLVLCNPDHVYYWKKFSLLAEALLLPAWLWFALTYARQKRFGTISLPYRLLMIISPLISVFALVLPIRSFVYSPDFSAEKILFLNNNGFIFYILMFVYLVAALIQLDQT